MSEIETNMLCRTKRRPCIPATRADIDRIDQALVIVDGHIVAAAKLIDIEPQRFRNLVNGNARLKAKWGYGKVGHPVGCPKLRIKPYDDEQERLARTEVGFITGILALMDQAQQQQIREWLMVQLKGPAQSSMWERELGR